MFDALTVVQFMKLFRLLKLLKFFYVFETFEKALVFRYEDLGVIRFLLFICFCLHWSACIFSWLDINICLQGDEFSSFVDSGLSDEGRSKQYLAALYWAFATMTTIGYGDISAKCSATRVFSLAVMLVASIVYAYGLSYVMEVLRNKRRSEAEFRDLMDSVNKYMAFRKVPKDLREEIRNFFNFVSESDAKKNELLSERLILEELSPELRVAVLCHVNSGLLEKVPLFLQIQECIGPQSTILQDVVLHMRSQVFRPYETVLKEGNGGNELFFVTSGTCVQIKWNRITVNVITEGEYYGEGGFLFARHHHAKSDMFDMNELSGKRNALPSLDELSTAVKKSLDLDDIKAENKEGNVNGSCDDLTPKIEMSGTVGKRHTYTAASLSHVEEVRAPQRKSASASTSSMLQVTSTMPSQTTASYVQRYSLVTQSYADLRYITRELFDEIVLTLPRIKLMKIHRLMGRRYDEVENLQKKRDLELENLYPEIKAEYESMHELDVDENEDESDWRKQEVDFVEEEVTSKLEQQDNPVKGLGRRASTVLATPRRRSSITNPVSSPRRKSVQPQHFNFQSPKPSQAKKNFPPSSPPGQKRYNKSLSSVATPRGMKQPLSRLPSGVLGSHDNSISAVVKQEHFHAAPGIYQSSVPTVAAVQPSHTRLFDRAMSLRPTNNDNSDSDSNSEYSLQSFDDSESTSKVIDYFSPSDSSQTSRKTVTRDNSNISATSVNVKDMPFERLNTIERSLSSLFNHVVTLKHELSQGKELTALKEEDEKSESAESENTCDEETETGFTKSRSLTGSPHKMLRIDTDV